MKHTKQLGNFSLADSLDASEDIHFLSRILEDRSSKLTSNPIKKFIPTESLSLSDLVQSFDTPSIDSNLEMPLENLMDSFITKHGSQGFKSLDELLTASLNQSSYESKSVKSLSDILDGLIEDL